MLDNIRSVVCISHFILYLHCNPKDPFGIDIERLCERLELEIGKDVWLPNNYNENKGFDITELSKKTGIERTHLYRKLKQLGIKI